MRGILRWFRSRQHRRRAADALIWLECSGASAAQAIYRGSSSTAYGWKVRRRDGFVTFSMSLLDAIQYAKEGRANPYCPDQLRIT